jgi:hypothetical protein
MHNIINNAPPNSQLSTNLRSVAAFVFFSASTGTWIISSDFRADFHRLGF